MLKGLGTAQITAEIVGYQRKGGGLPMHPHGHPDPTTLINMGLYDPNEHWANSQSNYIHGGQRPNTIMRDLQGVSNQIPQWAWLVAGTLFVGAGIYYYNAEAKKKKTRR